MLWGTLGSLASWIAPIMMSSSEGIPMVDTAGLASILKSCSRKSTPPESSSSCSTPVIFPINGVTVHDPLPPKRISRIRQKLAGLPSLPTVSISISTQCVPAALVRIFSCRNFSVESDSPHRNIDRRTHAPPEHSRKLTVRSTISPLFSFIVTLMSVCSYPKRCSVLWDTLLLAPRWT